MDIVLQSRNPKLSGTLSSKTPSRSTLARVRDESPPPAPLKAQFSIGAARARPATQPITTLDSNKEAGLPARQRSEPQALADGRNACPPIAYAQGVGRRVSPKGTLGLGFIFHTLSFLTVAVLFLLPAVDTDLGWHLRYGEHLLQTGQVLRQNTLTYFLSNYTWSHSYTLYQFFTALIYQTGGLWGLSLVYSLLMILMFCAFNKINLLISRINFLTFLAISALGWQVFNLGWRSQVFTILGLTLTFLILKKSQNNPRWLWLLPPLFTLWANFHGGFGLGLLVLFFDVTQSSVSQNWRRAVLGVIGTAGAALAALINPFGAGVYQEAWRHARYPLKNLIAEWVAPNPPLQLAILVTAFLVVCALLLLQNKNKLFWFLNLGLFAYLALDARRNLPLFGLVAGLGLIDLAYPKLLILEEQLKRQLFLNGLLGFVIVILLLFRLPYTFDLNTNWGLYCNKSNMPYPCEAIEFIRQNAIPGENVFTAFEWGGFLEWQLPQYRYFTDGRMPTWPSTETKSPYTIYLEIIQAQPGYQEKLDQYGTGWLLIGQGSFLDLELSRGKSDIWQEAYRDQRSVVYIKTSNLLQ